VSKTKIVFAVLFGAFGLWLYSAYLDDSHRLERLDRAGTPEEFIGLLFYEPKSSPKIVRRGNAVEITYNIDPWALTRSTTISNFNLTTARVIPKTFAKFKDIEIIQISAEITFKDIKGREDRGELFRTNFSRKNAESIVWDKIDWDNLPKISDRFWQHSNFSSP
jgi:hypothetical protein